MIEGTQTDEEKQRGKVFQSALDAYGGKKLLDEMYEAQRGGRDLDASTRGALRGEIYKKVEAGARGEEMFGTEFGPGFEKEREAQQQKVDFKLEEKAHKEEADEAKKTAAMDERNKHLADTKLKKYLEDAEKQSKADERFNREMQLDKLEDQKTALERQKRDAPKPEKFGTWSSGVDMMKALQGDILNDLPKQQLSTQKKIQEGIDKLNDQIKTLHREARAV